MSKKVRHVLGISGGKDSAALAIYLKREYPQLDIEYYFTDTGKELDETYQVIESLESVLGKNIIRLKASETETKDPFDFYYEIFGGYLPSSNARWCTKKLKLEPFERFVGNDPVISYVGIRGDEDREGYISIKSNIQSIFPYRKNIWSEDVVVKILKNENITALKEIYSFSFGYQATDRVIQILEQPISARFTVQQKLNLLLDQNIKQFNHAVFEMLKTTSYPLATETSFPLLDNEDVLVREDVFQILRESIGIPAYYQKIDFDSKAGKGSYARSRSGCYFCFFQQKIEWVWLYEQHPDLFAKAMEYENIKEGFTWNQNESLEELTVPSRIEAIKKEFLTRKRRDKKFSKLVENLDLLDDETEGCAACFI
ncbi:phosphoadenosine phosphosulfate reductase family protein [Flaviaesturariibacter terrae]